MGGVCAKTILSQSLAITLVGAPNSDDHSRRCNSTIVHVASSCSAFSMSAATSDLFRLVSWSAFLILRLLSTWAMSKALVLAWSAFLGDFSFLPSTLAYFFNGVRHCYSFGLSRSIRNVWFNFIDPWAWPLASPVLLRYLFFLIEFQSQTIFYCGYDFSLPVIVSLEGVLLFFGGLRCQKNFQRLLFASFVIT